MKGFTVIEVLLACVVLSMVFVCLLTLLVRESSQAVDLTEDLESNKETRLFFQLLSRDVRGAKQIVLDDAAHIAESKDPTQVPWIAEPGLEHSHLVLFSPSTSGDQRWLKVDYFLKGKKPAMVRTASQVDASGKRTLIDEQRIGHASGLSFYQVAERPTVYFAIAAAAGARYRHVFRGGVTARGVVPNAVVPPPPDAAVPEDPEL